MNLKNNINNNYDSDPTAKINFGAVGGNSEIWKNLDKLGQKHIKHQEPRIGEDLVKLAYELKKHYQLENPIKLDSKTATFEQVAFHAERWQRLSRSTIEHRLRCARRMMKHPVYPIDFNNLNYNQFIAYMDYRERYENSNMVYKRINITLPEDALEKLKKIGEDEDRPISNVIKRMIEKY